jgi:hypothetical protein
MENSLKTFLKYGKSKNQGKRVLIYYRETKSEGYNWKKSIKMGKYWVFTFTTK